MHINDDPSLRHELLNEFAAEAIEHLENAEQLLLAAETYGPQQDQWAQVMRAMHSIKGAASYLGLEAIQRLAHAAETAIQRLGGGGGEDAVLVPLLLQAVRELTQMVELPGEGTASLPSLLAALETIGVHDCSVGHRPALLPRRSVQQVFWDVAGQQCQALRAAADRLASNPQDSTATEMIRQALGSLARAAEYAGAMDVLGVLEPVSCDGGINSESVRTLATRVERLLDNYSGASQQSEPARSPASTITESRSSSAESPGMRTLRVTQERIDRLIDNVAELVTVRNQVDHFLSTLGSSGCGTSMCRQAKALSFCLRKAVDDVQDTAMALRLIRLETVFRPLPRIARDVAERTGKRVRLQVVGQELQVDKAIAEAIADPLLHLVRNALDHGIEAESERVLNGKPPQGLVQVAAHRRGNNIVIAVVDDGQGIDLGTVRSKAINCGLVTRAQAQELSDDELYGLLFKPGFSTTSTVTDVSGRGVGLDVVKSNVDRLGGSVTVQSVRGEGTRIEMLLPVRVAAQDVLLVRVGAETIGLPLHTVRESLSVARDRIGRLGGEPAAVSRGRVVPLVSMAKLLDMPGRLTPSSALQVLVVELARDQEVGIVVDEVGQHCQVVVKPLGGFLLGTGILGAALLADGRLVLTIDPIALIQGSVKSLHQPS